jgi:glucose-1-phosphate thymidylyltransferase
MKVVVLAAGYATRLHPFTLRTPKPLLEVAGRPMINYVMENLAPIAGIDHVYVVCNGKFAGQFLDWAGHYRKLRPELSFSIINDGSTDETNKLGAIGDLHLAIEKQQITEDLIVIAADNLLSENLAGFGQFCLARRSPVVGICDLGEVELTRKHNSIRVDASGRITHFEEKPKELVSSLIAIALYFYPAEVLPLIRQYIADGNNPDQPGRLVQWLYPRTPFYTWVVPGAWHDIGSRETLEQANRDFAARHNQNWNL